MYFGAQKINILIVDDNPKNLLALEAILQSPERNLARAASGDEALRYLLDHDVAVILLDVYMPGLDGLETAAMIRGRHKTRDTPIIFLTADSAGATHLLRGYSLGAVDFILKPIEPEILKSKVNVFVELYKKTSQVKRQAELLREKNLELENENLQRLTALVELGQELAAERNPRRLLEKFCHAANQIVGARCATIGMLAEDGASLRRLITSLPDANLPFDREAQAESKSKTLSAMLATRRPVRLRRNQLNREQLALAAAQQPQHSLLGAPIFTPAHLYGWLLLSDKLDQAGANEFVDFSEADERLAVTLAAQVAVTYENAKLYEESQTLAAELKQEVAERKQAEEARAEMLVREQAARREAETANKTKDEFLATLSHELRTPLTAILGWAQLMRKGGLDEEAQTRALETIRRNAQAQSQLIDDLLDVSRIITGKLHLDLSPVEIKHIVEAAIESIRPAAEANGIELAADLGDATPTVNGDAHRLQQVVWNLLSNAVKFTPDGGRIVVRLIAEKRRATITVTDTGHGIPAEYLPVIFDRFRQVDGTTTRTHGGLGLGLAIARHLVELHGGEVSANSDGVGQGATFTVRLPFHAQTLDQEQHTDGEIAPQASEENMGDGIKSTSLLENLRVLIVEDEQDTREMIATVLVQCGAEVRSSASAAEALEAFKVWTPDVLVSDIGMPGEDGYSLLRKLRAITPQGNLHLPSLALTAYASVEDRTRALTAGFQMHLAKPVEPVELIAIIASLAGRG